MTNTPKKSAIVTGASGGIGRAIAIRLAQDGFAVIVHYSGSADKANEVVTAIQSAGGQAHAIQADVANPVAVESLFQQAIAIFGSLTAVVHTAGIMLMSPITNVDVDAFDQTIATNLRGTFLVLGHAAKNLTAGGRIIAFSTSVIALNLPAYGPYIASKCGVEGLVHVLANELRGKQITVNAVAPGPVATPLFLKGKPEAVINHLSKLPPLERLGQPDDIVGAVSFLAGPDGAWVNSQVLRANGGFA